MSKSAYLFLSALLIPPLALADQIFKCAGKNGSALYQNYPCEYSSMSWKPIDAPRPGSSTASNSSSAPPQAKTPNVGMTQEQVKALWGPARNTYYDEDVDGRAEIWSYGNSRSVKFDAAGRVATVQR